MAGAGRYAQTWNGPAAVTTAANVAELNGVPTGNRTGTGTDTVADNYGNWNTSFTVDTSINVAANSAGTVTAEVRASAPTWFAGIIRSAATQALSATAVAAVSLSSTGGQPCILALKGDSNAVTTYIDISISGHTTVTSQTCGVRSDASLTVSGDATFGVPSVIASGTITVSDPATGISCPTSSTCTQAGVAQIPDPFYSTYYSQLSTPSGVGAGTVSGDTYSPGEYSSLSFSGNRSYTLNPGIYYVTGQISIQGNVTVIGNGVTLIGGPDGSLSMTGTATVNLTAPSTGPTAGLLFGTTSSNSMKVAGTNNEVLSGAVYAPNASVTVTGDSKSYTSESTCLDVVASTVTFTGNSSFTNTGCAGLGVPAMYNKPATAMLIQ
jgi:hypothetical protein